MNNRKAVLRRQFRSVRLSMSQAEVESKSRLITDRLLVEVDWSKVKKMHIYKSMPKLNEVETATIINNVQRKKPPIDLTVASLKKNQELPAQKYDLVIVPVLAFDKDNYRLGFGSGWYDRFLATQPQALKIGLAFQNGFVPDGLPHEPHDIPLDKVVTEI